MARVKTVSKIRTPAALRPGDPDPVVARWLRATLKSDPPRAKSLIVTLWGDALAPHGGAVWLAALIRLLQPLRINERSVRTSVFRLVRDGWLSAEAHGRRSRYRLTRGGMQRFEQAYRRIYLAPDPTWEGEWEIVLVIPESTPARRNALRRELGWAGFGIFGPGVYARPAHDDVLAWTPSALAAAAPFTLVRGRDTALAISTKLEARVAHAWDLHTIAQDYRRLLARFGHVIEAFRVRGSEHSNPAQCFAVRTLLIHAFRRVLLRDPQLPPALLPLDWPGAAAYTLTRDFYRLTHRLAEAHLASTFAFEQEQLGPANAGFQARFGGLG